MIVSANSAALQILKGLQELQNTQQSYWAEDKANWVRPPNHGPWFGPGVPGQVEPISDLTKDAIARIVAIVGEGGSVDLSGQSYTHSSISAKDNATIIGGEGDDSISAYNHATVVGGAGKDSIGVYRYANVDSGAGDDSVYTYTNSHVVAGEGNDWVYTEGGNSKVDAGAGDDYVKGGGDYMQVDAGAGNDEIRVYDHATVDGGTGDDLIVTYGASTIKGGAGNDIVIATENSDPEFASGSNDIDGGEGDDYLQTTDNSTVRGGTGNDVIRLIGAGSTVTFAKGDGQDAILSADDFTLSVGGYGKDEATVNMQGDELIVSFKGSDDQISLNLSSGATAHLVFEDGSSLDVTGNEKARALSYLWSRPDWVRDEAYQVRSSAAGRASW